MFELWSKTNNDAQRLLSPDLGLRDWDTLSEDDKVKIWHYLKTWFEVGEGVSRVFLSVLDLNDRHKFRAYAIRTLQDTSVENASKDFQTIFFTQKRDVVLELFSCFCNAMLDERAEMLSQGKIWKSSSESDQEWVERLTEWKYVDFNSFADSLNDVFEQFGVNLVLTRSRFIERQDPKIVSEIYTPVLNFLSLPKWKDSEREMRDAFQKYQEKTEHGYSNCITHAISALEAFLQILIEGKTGSSSGLSALITQGKEKSLLPLGEFSEKVIKGIGDTLMRERGKSGDGHPKKEYANEKNARLVLNLVIVFMQHCIQK